MSEIDPSWTAEEAYAVHATALEADPSRDPADPTLPFPRWCALQNLRELEAQYHAGDRMALMAAMRECARAGIAPPSWAAEAFIKGYDSVLNCRVGSWDAAYGAPYPKGTQLAALRKRRLNRAKIYKAVIAAIVSDPTRPIDAGLFEEVGREFYMSKGAAEALYYDAVRQGFQSASDWKRRAGWK